MVVDNYHRCDCWVYRDDIVDGAGDAGGLSPGVDRIRVVYYRHAHPPSNGGFGGAKKSCGSKS